MPDPAPLSAAALFKLVRQMFAKVSEHRPMNIEVHLGDALMAGFALFSLKDPSLLAFDERRAAPENRQRIYHLQQIPSDIQMRTILDDVTPEQLRPVFTQVFQTLRRLCFMGHYYLVSWDGAGYFGSKKIPGAQCRERKNSRTGEITYPHQLLGGATVCPGHAEVVPICPEPLIKQDDSLKNDCERNAAQRFLQHLREDYPHVPFIITEEALSAQPPPIRERQRHHLQFILGVKPSDHTYLFDYVAAGHARAGRLRMRRATPSKIKGTIVVMTKVPTPLLNSPPGIGDLARLINLV